jgi:protein SCO1
VLLSVLFSSAFFWLSGCAKAPEAVAPLPDFSLTAVTVDGVTPLDLAALKGRVWVAGFVFTRCAGPCPLITENMAWLQGRLPASVGLLSFSVDPDHDSPEVLSVYARRHKADPQRWLFVTGPKAELVRLVRDGFKLPVAENAQAAPGERVTHAARLVLLDKDARIRGWYEGVERGAMDRLIRDAKSL